MIWDVGLLRRAVRSKPKQLLRALAGEKQFTVKSGFLTRLG